MMLFSPALAWQEAALVVTNTLLVLTFAYDVYLFCKRKLAFFILLLMSFAMEWTSFLMANHCCPDFYVHGKMCPCNDCDHYYETHY